MALVLVPLTTIVLVASLVLAVVAGAYTALDRVIDDRLLLVAAVVELLLVVQAVVACVVAGQVRTPGEGPTMAAYAVTLPLVPPALAYLAIKEKSRWAMGAVLGGALVVAVMTLRIQQIWTVHA
ncbi:hypothetical protein GCM10009633_22190 [Janibacter melonis]